MNAARWVMVVLAAVMVISGTTRGDDEKARVEMIRKASRGVFRIGVTGNLERIATDKSEPVSGGAGSGFLVEEGGRVYVVTNHHVLKPPAGRRWAAGSPRIVGSSPALLLETGNVELELVGSDELSDLAVLRFRKFGADDLIKGCVLTFAKPESIELGQSVVAIGYPRRQSGGASVSVGVVGALNRSIDGGAFGGLVQTDAAINPGNSGGPLLNLKGEVVGVNTYGFGNRMTVERIRVPVLKTADGVLKVDGYREFEVLSDIDTTEGMSYARSPESAVPVVRQLVKFGAIRRPDLGFSWTTLPWNLAQLFDLREGALVTGVKKSGPAAGAAVEPGLLELGLGKVAPGLLPNDVIHEVRWSHAESRGAAQIRCEGDLLNALVRIPPGSKIELNASRPTSKMNELIGEAISKGWHLKGGLLEGAKHALKLGEKSQNLTVKFSLPTP